MQDDIIRNESDLRKALDDAGLKHIPIFELENIEMPKINSEIERRKIQLDAIKRARNNRGEG